MLVLGLPCLAVWVMVVQGFVARVIHVAATTALMKTLTSLVYDLIYGDSKKIKGQ